MNNKIEYLVAGGILTTEAPDNNAEILGKRIVNEDTGFTRHFLRFEQERLVDPNNRDTRRFQSGQGQLRLVQVDAFTLYNNFLKTNKHASLMQAERTI